MDSSVPRPVCELVLSMLQIDPADRPGAAEVQRRCEILAGRQARPEIADWARTRGKELSGSSEAGPPAPVAIAKAPLKASTQRIPLSTTHAPQAQQVA